MNEKNGIRLWKQSCYWSVQLFLTNSTNQWSAFWALFVILRFLIYLLLGFNESHFFMTNYTGLNTFCRFPSCTAIGMYVVVFIVHCIFCVKFDPLSFCSKCKIFRWCCLLLKLISCGLIGLPCIFECYVYFLVCVVNLYFLQKYIEISMN